MMSAENSTWRELLEVVETLAARPEPEVPSRDRPGSVTHFDVRPGLVFLELSEDVDREALAAEVGSLGPPAAIDVVSPPPAGGGRPPWDSKRSVIHEMAGRRVGFGIEETGGIERLVSISIRFDGPPVQHLPPEDREGPFRLTTSLGWCGGFGEAVLDETNAIRYHDDLPIFLDATSQEAVLGRVDLSGSRIGETVIRITGHGRLERRKGRNTSIPGAPKRMYVALVITVLESAVIRGEREAGS